MFKSKSKTIGVDVGGTKILLQTFDRKGEVVIEEKIKTQTKKGQKSFVDELVDLIGRHFHPGIQFIGVAVPGIVDQKKGVLVKAPHLPVKNLKLKDILHKKFKRPVFVDNDINGFLMAQKQQTQLKKAQNLVAVMVGTGVGGAIMSEGKMLYGKQGFAGEVGHIVLRSDHPLSTLEMNVGGSYISKIAKSLGIKTSFSTLDLGKKSPQAKKVKAHLVRHLGLGLASLNLIFNPEAFVLGGSIYELFLKDSKKELQKIIASRALDKKSPPIIDAQHKYTVAMGVAMKA